METLELVRLMSFGLFSVASVILLYFIVVYVRFVLADTYRHGWWLISVATGAGCVYGGAGIIETYGGIAVAEIFRHGASLFFILFLALGIRAITRLEGNGDENVNSTFLDYGFDFLIVGLCIALWWSLFAIWQPTWFVVLHSLGWFVMVIFALYFAYVAVEQHEGTSVAAVIRDLLPAVICFGVIIVVEIIYQYTGRWANFAEATWIVGIVLVSAFLFNTATTIRQEEAELHRIYDPSTWREQTPGEGT